MSDISLERRTVEVCGIPGDVDNEYLTLYFENKRRSGGGPLASVQRNGSRAVLVFEESEVAERVLAKGTHTVQNTTLLVRKKAPHDPRMLLLRGINPSTSLELVQLYVENMTDVDSNEYTMHRSPRGDLALIYFHYPLPQDFLNVSVKINKKPLDGASIHSEQVEHTNSILVRNLSPKIKEDLLKLYFESERGGETEVKVVMIKDGIAKVSFEDFNAVTRILGKSHRLEERNLEIQPYFDFLQTEDHPQAEGLEQTQNKDLVMEQSDSLGSVENGPEKQAQMRPITDQYLADHPVASQGMVDEGSMDAVGSTFSSKILLPDPLKLSLFKTSKYLKDLQQSHPSYFVGIVDTVVEIAGPSLLGTEQLKGQLLEFLTGFAQVHLTFDERKAMFLSREEVKDRITKNLKQQGLPSVYTVSDCVVMVMSLSLHMAEEACNILKSSISEFSIAVSPDLECMWFSKEWSTFLNSLDFCLATVSDKGDKLEVLTVKGMEDEKQSRIIEFLSTPVQAESVITMEPGRLQYIQTYYEQILAEMDQVSVLPLDAQDVSGFRIHGNFKACQAADEFLRSIMTSIQTKTITVNQPGVARFLLQGEGAEILKEMQVKFEVYISLEKVHWEPLENEDIIESAWKITSQQNFNRNSSDSHQRSTSFRPEAAERGLLEEAKKLVSVIQMESVSSAPNSLTRHSDLEDVDLYTSGENNPTTNTASQAENNSVDSEGGLLQAALGGDAKILGTDLEEDAELYLAVQFSMEHNTRLVEAEDDELKRALELSKRMSVQETGTAANSQLDRAIQMSLQDAIMAANSAEILVFARYSHDLIRVDIALGKKIGVRQCEEKVEHKCLKTLSNHQKKCIDIIRRKHAVDIHIQGTTAIITGFKEYVQDAISEVKQLLKWISNTKSDAEILRTVQWVWHNSESGPVPYSDKASIFLENSWRMKQKKIDIVFDNQPCIINFETMHEYSIASGKSIPIERKVLTSPNMAVPEDYSLLSNMSEASKVDESSDEFCSVVRDFYDTIQEYHNKIKIIKVEKITNNLLLSQYKLKKASIKQSAIETEVERTLYHGTSEMSVKEICLHGFNRSFCGKNATLYGQGVYFAVNAAISVQDQYSPPNADGHKYVFVTKVLTGDFTMGNREMKTTPLKENSDMPLRYHSVVDRVASPTLFVIFNDTQAYPEYLITCKKIHG